MEHQVKYSTVTIIENRMICPQMMSAIAEFCKGDKDLTETSKCDVWTMQHMDSESDSFSYSYVLCILAVIILTCACTVL